MNILINKRHKLIEILNISKVFPGVLALDDVSLDVKAGEIHAVVGENGAGKSTLMHIIAGVYIPEKGSMRINGHPYFPKDEKSAQDEGVGIVYQEGSLFPPLNVAENIFAGRQKVNSVGIINTMQMYKETRELLGQLDILINPATTVENLSMGQRQLVEIAKALSQNVKVLILDEPTSSLTTTEARHLFKVIKRLAARGVGIIYVTHRLIEIFEIADRVTVLKDGKITGLREVSTTTQNEIIQLQVGRELSFERDSRRVKENAQVILELDNLFASGVNGVSLKVKAGEIVCLAGLVGAGRTELCEAIFGNSKIFSGTIKINGKSFMPKHPIDAMRAGIGMVPEDRYGSGLFLPMSIAVNISAASMDSVTYFGIINDKKINEVAQKYCDDLRVATPNIKRLVMYLSGGNQQKVLLAKWLVRNPKLFIIDEPTRGVDVGAKSDLYNIIRELSKEGVALLIVSSDLPEVLSLAHRIIVMAEGKKTGELDPGKAEEREILHMAIPSSVI